MLLTHREWLRRVEDLRALGRPYVHREARLDSSAPPATPDAREPSSRITAALAFRRRALPRCGTVPQPRAGCPEKPSRWSRVAGRKRENDLVQTNERPC